MRQLFAKTISLSLTFSTFLLLEGCKTKLPETPEECVIQSKKILDITKTGDFKKLKGFFKSINYLDNVSAEDYEKGFTGATNKLNKYGVPSDNHIKMWLDTFQITRDTHSLNFTIEYQYDKEDSLSTGCDKFTFVYNKLFDGYELSMYSFDDTKRKKLPLPSLPPPKMK